MLRSCVGCRKVDSAEHLVRFVLGSSGTVVPDLEKCASGRGAWLHPSSRCLARAVPRGLGQALRHDLTVRAAELQSSLRAEAELRAYRLLFAAHRAKELVMVASVIDAAEPAPWSNQVELIILATDADPAALRLMSGTQKRIYGFGTKESLGFALGRAEVSVVGVLGPGFARELERAVVTVSSMWSVMPKTAVTQDVLTEVG